MDGVKCFVDVILAVRGGHLQNQANIGILTCMLWFVNIFDIWRGWTSAKFV